MISLISPSGLPNIDGLLYPYKWNAQTLTYSFPQKASVYGVNESDFEPLTEVQKNYVIKILDEISGFTNLRFEKSSDDSNGVLRFAKAYSPATAYAELPHNADWGGDSWYKIGLYENPQDGTYDAYGFWHEIGHALGLKHGHEATYFGALPYERDSNEFSWMTYRSYVGATGQYYEERYGSGPQSYMMDDIAALQYLYGANFSARATDTIYKWSESSGATWINGEIWRAPPTNTIVLTLWDGGGTDTYDFSDYTNDLFICLEPGQWSMTSPDQLARLDGSGTHLARGNIANANLYQSDQRSIIEKAKGGAGNDEIIGNVANNRLGGGAGNDTLFGDGTFLSRGGNDTLLGQDGSDRLEGGIGNDVLDGGAGNDTAKGGDGDDIFSAQKGIDLSDGGDGFDRMRFSSSFEAYTIVVHGGTTSISNPIGLTTEVSNTITNTERLLFSDKVLALDVIGHAGAAFRLYEAALDRLPDEHGLAGWIKYLDDGFSLDQAAAQFIGSFEFGSKYGPLDSEAFVALLYHNVLGRAGETGGLLGWVEGLSNGLTRSEVLAGFSESEEHRRNTLPLVEQGIIYEEWWRG